MPVLHQYVGETRGANHYFRDAIPQQGFTTIQITTAAEELLLHAGYEAGDRVPQRLVRGLLDVGLCFTWKSQRPSGTPETAANEQLNDVPEETRLLLRGYVESYDGIHHEAVAQLPERFELPSTVPEWAVPDVDPPTGPASGLQSIAETYFGSDEERTASVSPSIPDPGSLPDGVSAEQIETLPAPAGLRRALNKLDDGELSATILSDEAIALNLARQTGRGESLSWTVELFRWRGREPSGPDLIATCHRTSGYRAFRGDVSHRIAVRNGTVTEYELIANVKKRAKRYTRVDLDVEGERDQVLRGLMDLVEELPVPIIDRFPADAELQSVMTETRLTETY
jgi:hypothetical protein